MIFPIPSCFQVIWTQLPCKNFHLLLCVAILNGEKDIMERDDYDFNDILKVRYKNVKLQAKQKCSVTLPQHVTNPLTHCSICIPKIKSMGKLRCSGALELSFLGMEWHMQTYALPKDITSVLKTKITSVCIQGTNYPSRVTTP